MRLVTPPHCSLCGGFCEATRKPLTLCPNYYPLRDALFGGLDALPAEEERLLRWLAGMLDAEARATFIAMVKRAKGIS